MLIPKKARSRKRRMGSTGFFARNPWRTKTARRSVPAIRPVSTSGSVQPSLVLLTSA